MIVLVTGGAGFIGSHVVDRLVAAGHAVHIVDDLSTGQAALIHPAARFHRIDIRSDRLATILHEATPDVVVHLAAQVDVRRSVADPLFDASINVVGTLNLLESCRRSGAKRVVFASSGGAIYGEGEVIPTPELHPLRPASPYGVAKLAGEHYIATWADLTGATMVALRYANVYGPRQNPQGEAGVIAIFLSRLLAGRPCVIYGDGEHTRDYVFVEDVADATVRAATQGESRGIANVGTGVETTVNDLYRRLAAVAQVNQAPQFAPSRPGEQRRSALDPSFAKTLLGWTPATALETGLARTLEFFRT